MWHKECFKCGNCAKGLDSISCCEGPDRNIYCKGVISIFYTLCELCAVLDCRGFAFINHSRGKIRNATNVLYEVASYES